MGGLLQPVPVSQEPNTTYRAIVISIVVIVAIALSLALILRPTQKAESPPPAYASRLKLVDLKMSQAQNFVGATVTYVDGNLVNAGDKTVTGATVRVTFKDLYGQVAQIEQLPVRLLTGSGAYQDTIEVAASPLAPSQSRPFRLIFEHVSAQWNRSYPELEVTEVGLE
jgi:hypothetical protein